MRRIVSTRIVMTSIMTGQLALLYDSG